METRTGTARRLVVAAPLYPPESGGPATYAAMIERLLPAHGYDMTVVPFRDVRKYPKLIRHVVYLLKLRRAAKQADLIYALDAVSVGVPTLCAHWLSGTPFMVRLGGDYAWEQGQQRFGLATDLDVYTRSPHSAPLPVRFLAALQRTVVRRAVRVIVPSDYLRSIVATWGVRDERLHRIYTAQTPLTEERDQATARQQLGLSDHIVLSFGRLVPWKGNHALIDAVAALKDEFPDITLLIGGDGPEEQSLIEHSEQVGMPAQIRVLGRFSREQVAAYLRAADVYVLNTGYEGLSHQLLEALQLGTPIVTTPVGGNPELITEGETGLLVPHDDVPALAAAIKKIFIDPTLRERFTKNGPDRTAAFSETQVISELVAVLKETV